MAKFCENCGARVNDGAKFCNECGKRLSGSWLYDKFLHHDGRLNRWNFFKRNILLVLIAALIGFTVAFTAGLFTQNEKLAVIIASIVMLAVSSYLEYPLIIRRCHDLKQNSWLHSCISKDDTSVAKFIVLLGITSGICYTFKIENSAIDLMDIVNGILNIYLTFAPGESGENEYGEPDAC